MLEYINVPMLRLLLVVWLHPKHVCMLTFQPVREIIARGCALHIAAWLPMICQSVTKTHHKPPGSAAAPHAAIRVHVFLSMIARPNGLTAALRRLP